MVNLHIAALLAFGAMSVQAQPSSPVAQIEPSPDSAEQRQALRALSMCLAETRPGWARRTLSHPYLSSEQATDASQALGGRDNCLRTSEAEITFRTSSLIGGMAEYFLQAEMRRADSSRLSEALGSLTPLNGSEDFALCVVSRNPAAARDLALSEPGSAQETQAVQQVAVHVRPCLNPGERQAVDQQALRSLVSTALYRGLTTALAARN